jgi:FkbM family methyltransferase
MKCHLAGALKLAVRTGTKLEAGRFPWLRKGYHLFLLPLMPDLALFQIQIDGIDIKVKVPKQDAIFTELYTEGSHEEGVVRKLREILKEGMTFIDVGASFGYFTVLAAKAVGKGKVYAFEPNPAMYNLLLENIALNQLSNVIPVNKAVSSERGAAKLFLASNIGASNILAPRDQKGIVEVECVTLDEFCNDERNLPIDVLKMDIEGGEILAIKGMEKTLANNKDLKMLIEFHPHLLRASGHKPGDLWPALRRNGFWPPLWLSDDGREIITSAQRNLEEIENEKHPVHLFIERGRFSMAE